MKVSVVASAALIFTGMALRAAVLSIVNPGFEEPALSDGGYTLTEIIGWTTIGPEAGVFNPTDIHYPGASGEGAGVPEGRQVAYMNHPGSFSQTLPEKLQANMKYTLSVIVGDRKDMSVGGYSVELRAGSSVLGAASPPTVDGGFVTATVTYTALPGDPLIGNNLVIHLSKSDLIPGDQVNFDDVRLEATVLPNSLTIEPSGGAFDDAIEVRLFSSVEDGEIRYTLDSTEPTTSATLYGGRITLCETALVRARVFAAGVPASEMVTARFTKRPQGRKIVVPNACAQTEGNGWSGTLAAPIRLQEVYAACHFPSFPIVITEIRFRPNWFEEPLQGRVNTTLDNIHLLLSTTTRTPDQLSGVFADNRGPDETLVFSGCANISTTSSGPAGEPKNFDIVFTLGVPFVYVPSKGNLLFEVRNYSRSALIAVDQSNEPSDQASRVFIDNPSSPVGTIADTGCDVLQFVYLPQPPQLLLMPDGGDSSQPISVAMLTGVTDGVIRYTLDGSDPSVDSPSYQAPVRLSQTTTVKARVFADGTPASDVFSGTYTITLSPPTITVQPKSKTVVEGGSASFRVAAVGSPPFAYQWVFGGADIPNATEPTLTIASANFDNAGSYTVKVSNDAGLIFSDAAVLTVTARPVAPEITWQPLGQTVPIGGTAEFTVAATGTEPLTYQWRRSGMPLAGANGPTYKINNVQPSDAGLYAVRVSNALGSVTSRQALLTVIETPLPPTVTAPPQDQQAAAGADVTLFVTATGTAPLAYQWRFNGAAIEGATGSTLTLRNAQPANSGTYTVTVSNGVGSVTTDGAVVDVNAGQTGGTVAFNNHAPAAGIGAPVFDADGTTKLEGPAFLAQLYAGPSPETLGPVGPAVPFLTGAGAGCVSTGPTSVRIIPTVPAGQTASVEVRAWECAKGTTYEQALAMGGKAGRSALLSVTTGGVGDPPSIPADLAGLTSFSIGVEKVAPVVTITSPIAETTHDERATLEGTVTDNGTVAGVRWERDGTPAGDLLLTGGQFSVPNLVLHQGENRFRVTATDMAGNEGAAEVLVVWQPSRTLSVIGGDEKQEGLRVAASLAIQSEGDAGGLSFLIKYAPECLRDPELAWTEVVASGISQVNFDTPGQVRATLSLPASVIPAGTHVLAELSFRARSVPARTTTPIEVEVLDVADQLGNPLPFGTAVSPGAVSITPRKIIADNNGNDRLDIGDATLIQRLIARLDEARYWDVTGNDLNQSSGLDSGDVIKVLRASVGLDPQPTVPAGGGGGCVWTHEVLQLDPWPVIPPSGGGGGAIMLAIDRQSAATGDTITVQVRLNGVSDKVFGTAFALGYPAEALCLAGTRPLAVGGLVPPDSAVIWNVAQAQGGQIAWAISSANAWNSATGVIAEIKFTVQPGAAGHKGWSVVITNAEVTTQNGYEIQALAGVEALFEGLPRVPISALELTGDGFQATIEGAAGLTYSIEASTDLVNWEPLQTVTNVAGTVQFTDPSAVGQPMRFYRFRQLQ